MKEQKIVLITGSSGGIGQALCSVFKQNDYRVIGLDIIKSDAEVDLFLEVNLDRFCRDELYCSKTISQVEEFLGESQKLDALINNAAIQILKPMEQIVNSDWSKTLNINLVAPFLLSQKLFSFLEKAKGSIVNIASIHAKLTKPEFICYATSKAALVGLTKSMAVELGRKIRVNAICPAAIATPMLLEGFQGKAEAYKHLSSMHPIGRIGKSLEVAELALFLASDKALFVHGASFDLDGGISSRLYDPS